MNNGTPQYRPMILYVYRINLLITMVQVGDDYCSPLADRMIGRTSTDESLINRYINAFSSTSTGGS